MMKWEYKGIYRKYNMDGVINIGEGTIEVCDLTKRLPEFMKRADVLFIDPPCSEGNLKSFYTKADKEKDFSFDYFYDKLFEKINEIQPDLLFLEVFKSNKDKFIEMAKKQFSNLIIYESKYYNNPKNKCWILQCSNTYDINNSNLNGMDEEKIIKWICENIKYSCIGDLCMGRGLVGKYSHKNNKPFVGIELNKKRLAVLVDYIYEDLIGRGFENEAMGNVEKLL